MKETLRISLWSPKGGVGSTTVAANIAACMAYRGHRVVLTDATLQNILQYHFHYLSQQTGHQPQSQLSGTGDDKDSRDIIRTSVGIDIRTGWYKGFSTRNRAVAESVESVVPENCDVAISDYMSGSRSGLVHAYRHSDVVIVCVNPEPCCFSTIPMLMQLLAHFEGEQEVKKVRVLLNKTDSAKSLFADTRRVIKRTLGERLLQSELPDDLSVPESFAKGRTVNSYMPNSKASAVFHELSEELLAQYKRNSISAGRDDV